MGPECPLGCVYAEQVASTHRPDARFHRSGPSVSSGAGAAGSRVLRVPIQPIAAVPQLELGVDREGEQDS